ncbi:MAG: CvpA family protein [Prevotellaceae bacterium]|jgi:membrane protein required for colicin V production|nr:CvpA family protein [Prevotellaceae bacterium]
MSIFDIVFALLFCVAVYSGFRQGFIMQVAALLSIVLGVYFAVKFSAILAKWITGFGVGTQAVAIISFALIFIVVLLLARLVAHLAQRIVRLAMLGWLNRLLGVIFSLVKTALIISITLFIINTIDRELRFMPSQQVGKSKLYAPLSALAPWVLPYLDFSKIKSSLYEIDKRVDKKIEEFK